MRLWTLGLHLIPLQHSFFFQFSAPSAWLCTRFWRKGSRTIADLETLPLAQQSATIYGFQQPYSAFRNAPRTDHLGVSKSVVVALHFFADGRPGAGDTLRELPFTLASRQKNKTPKVVSNSQKMAKQWARIAKWWQTKAFLETFFRMMPNPKPLSAVARLWHLVVINLSEGFFGKSRACTGERKGQR